MRAIALTAAALAVALPQSVVHAGDEDTSHRAPAERSRDLPAGAPVGDGGLSPFGEGERVEDEVVVRFHPATTGSQRAQVAGLVGSLQAQDLGVPGLEVVRLGRHEGVAAAIRRLEADPRVDYAEPNYLYRVLSLPDDARFGELWGLQNIGQTIKGVASLADADIDAPEAWDITTGNKTVKVAVVDSGVDLTHPDLAPNVVGGWDFVDDDAEPFDLNSHGTHVAGTIGARGNDGRGVAGVNWDVSIIPVRVMGGDGMGTSADIAAGMRYAVAQGAKVVNMSLGGSQFSRPMYDAIASSPKALFVVAAGNEGANNDATGSFPCNYELANVICVAATDARDALAGFSNYGAKKVDVAAPGVDVLSSVPPSSVVFAERFETTPAFVRGGINASWGMEADALGRYASDSPYDFYLDNTDSFIRTEVPVDLSAKTGCSLNYWMYLDTEFQADGVLIEASTDGATWTTIDGWTGWSETWYPFSIDLSAYDGKLVSLRFRLVTDGDITADGVYIDDVAVGCDVTGYSGTEYEYMPGTSMATPHVAGVAALLWAAQPTASVAQVKAAILRGVDQKASLSGKVVTGGRLNARGSLDYLLTAPADDGKSATKILAVRKSAAAITVVGEVTPPHDGFNMSITLSKRSGGSYRLLAKKTPALAHRAGYDDRSFFVASFKRPSSGDCRIKALFVGDGDHTSSKAARSFSC